MNRRKFFGGLTGLLVGAGIVKAKEPEFYGPAITDLIDGRKWNPLFFDEIDSAGNKWGIIQTRHHAEDLMPFKYPFETVEDKYWEAQWQIGELEELLSV